MLTDTRKDSMEQCQSLGVTIGRVARAFVRGVYRYWKNAGLDVTIEQWSVLTHLWAKDGLAQQELCVCADRDKPSTTRLIDTMEKHNLVVRVPDQHDRRVKLIYLTHKGRELQQTLMDGIKAAEQEALHGIAEADIDVCLRVLRQVYTNISNE